MACNVFRQMFHVNGMTRSPRQQMSVTPEIRPSHTVKWSGVVARKARQSTMSKVIGSCAIRLPVARSTRSATA